MDKELSIPWEVSLTRRRSFTISLRDQALTCPLKAGTFIRCSSESPLSLADGVLNVLKEVSQGATKITSRTRVVLLRKRNGKCCLEFVTQPLAPKSNPLSPVESCCHQDLLRVSEIWSLRSMPRADKLYTIPAVTGSDLLSPGFQALVPRCRGKPRTLKELPLC
ncbi:hypothetical protein PIB30_039469 [Stylosanthes scabra]|uniref:Uncharacterized protein n=1 Tax=Stylosanthes scabra TaxID=79078 RepID=A0ABU6WEB8_9FABA|nr:hypothetical protein [Stylosanthes scabra]